MPCTRHAHAMHTPCTCHAHAMHMLYAHTMHMLCTLTAGACSSTHSPRPCTCAQAAALRAQAAALRAQARAQAHVPARLPDGAGCRERSLRRLTGARAHRVTIRVHGVTIRVHGVTASSGLQARLEAQTERLSAALEAPEDEAARAADSFGAHRLQLVRLASDARCAASLIHHPPLPPPPPPPPPLSPPPPSLPPSSPLPSLARHAENA